MIKFISGLQGRWPDLNSKPLKYLLIGCASLGALVVSQSVYDGVKDFFKYCIAWRLNLKDRYGGGWALVTGASDGCGKQYCFELARSGFDIILMARN